LHLEGTEASRIVVLITKAGRVYVFNGMSVRGTATAVRQLASVMAPTGEQSVYLAVVEHHW
jgi:hypothetical protein